MSTSSPTSAPCSDGMTWDATFFIFDDTCQVRVGQRNIMFGLCVGASAISFMLIAFSTNLFKYTAFVVRKCREDQGRHSKRKESQKDSIKILCGIVQIAIFSHSLSVMLNPKATRFTSATMILAAAAMNAYLNSVLLLATKPLFTFFQLNLRRIRFVAKKVTEILIFFDVVLLILAMAFLDHADHHIYNDICFAFGTWVVLSLAVFAWMLYHAHGRLTPLQQSIKEMQSGIGVSLEVRQKISYFMFRLRVLTFGSFIGITSIVVILLSVILVADIEGYFFWIHSVAVLCTVLTSSLVFLFTLSIDSNVGRFYSKAVSTKMFSTASTNKGSTVDSVESRNTPKSPQLPQ